MEAYKICHQITTEFPRFSKYTLGSKIDNLFTRLIELLILARYSAKDKKLAIINKACVKLDALKFFLKIAFEIKAMDNKHYIGLSENLAEMGKMLGGWRKQLITQTPPKNNLRGE